MSDIWKDGVFAADEWIVIADEDAVPPAGAVLVSLQRWQSERDALAGRNAPLGLVFEPDADWSDITDDLARFAVIAIAFPKFMEGRGFSIARLLRDRDGFTGEIRAVGEFTLDQMPLMRRVGIDAFTVNDANVRKALDRGDWPEVAALHAADRRRS